MNEREIRFFFELDRGKILSLKEQLAEKLGVFISSSPAGTLLPPERKLAEVLGISRVTVRAALKKYFDRGQLVSCGRGGTRVAKGHPTFDRLDPAVFGLPLPRTELRFLCYENLPCQEAWWRKVADMYNRLHPAGRVQIHFVDIHSYPAVFDYLGGDLLSIPFWDDMRRWQTYFQPLPGDFQRPGCDPDLMKTLFSDDPVFDYAVPVEIQFRQLMWNRKLADDCALGPLTDEIACRGFFGVVRHAHEKLPEKFRIGGHVWDLVSFSCVPENGELSPAVAEILEELTALPAAERIFFTSQVHSFDMVENFWKGRQLLVDVFANFCAHFGRPHFPAEAILFPLPEKRNRVISAPGVGISRQCREPEAAADFIRFLLSEEIQRELFYRKYTLPLRRDLLVRTLAEEFPSPGSDAETCAASLRLPAGTYAQAIRWIRFAVYGIRQEIIMAARHELPCDEALERIRRKWLAVRKGNEDADPLRRAAR